jgi:long-chain acyl-CoA synthetase
MSLFLYQNPSATNQVIDRDGWLDTGDIGWIFPYHSIGRSRNSGGVIVVEGRTKDTIVLSSGIIEVGNFEARPYVCSIMCAFYFFNPL